MRAGGFTCIQTPSDGRAAFPPTAARPYGTGHARGDAVGADGRTGHRLPEPPAAPRIHDPARLPRASSLVLLIVFRSVLFPFLMAIYIAYLVEPVVRAATRSRLLGIKWTRGPTIVVIYVLVLGGLAVLGWMGITKLATTIRSTSQSHRGGARGGGAPGRLPPAAAARADRRIECRPRAEQQDVIIPKSTRLFIRDGEYATLYRSA